MNDKKWETQNEKQEKLTKERLEKELAMAEAKLRQTEKLIVTVEEELKRPWDEEYEERPCCEDDYEGDLK